MLGLQLDAATESPPAPIRGGDGADLQLDGVEHDRLRRGMHGHRDRLVAGEGGGTEVGSEQEVVPAGDDGAWQPIGIAH